MRLKEKYEQDMHQQKIALTEQREDELKDKQHLLVATETELRNRISELEEELETEKIKFENDRNQIEQKCQTLIEEKKMEMEQKSIEFEQALTKREEEDRKKREDMLVEITHKFEEHERFLLEQAENERTRLIQIHEDALGEEQREHRKNVGELREYIDSEQQEHQNELRRIKEKEQNEKNQINEDHRKQIQDLQKRNEQEVNDLTVANQQLLEQLNQLQEQATIEKKETQEIEDSARRSAQLEREQERKHYEQTLEEIRRSHTEDKLRSEAETEKTISEINERWREEMERLRSEQESEKERQLEAERRKDQEREISEQTRTKELEERHDKRVKALKKEFTTLLAEEKKKYEELQKLLEVSHKEWKEIEGEMKDAEKKAVSELEAKLSESEDQITALRNQFSEMIKQRDAKTQQMLESQARSYTEALKAKDGESEMWKKEAREMEDRKEAEKDKLEKEWSQALEKEKEEKRRLLEENTQLKKMLGKMETTQSEEREQWKSESERRAREEDRKESELINRAKRAEHIKSSTLSNTPTRTQTSWRGDSRDPADQRTPLTESRFGGRDGGMKDDPRSPFRQTERMSASTTRGRWDERGMEGGFGEKESWRQRDLESQSAYNPHRLTHDSSVRDQPEGDVETRARRDSWGRNGEEELNEKMNERMEETFGSGLDEAIHTNQYESRQDTSHNWAATSHGNTPSRLYSQPLDRADGARKSYNDPEFSNQSPTHFGNSGQTPTNRHSNSISAERTLSSQLNSREYASRTPTRVSFQQDSNTRMTDNTPSPFVPHTASSFYSQGRLHDTLTTSQTAFSFNSHTRLRPSDSTLQRKSGLSPMRTANLLMPPVPTPFSSRH
ncbi:hypothetical protein BLNAU_15418 [Blattamonas nauphoetae]|uniref:Trichohyalin-like n=1 Tax=Blattamonas nauphoetae TaxID=2049346 RepID=A0ABQ9XEB9_9EUKA|nr:hypothetical protein BLNAU_15418 [Blattamonas nauphoetae]